MVVMFFGLVVLGSTVLFVLFLLKESHRAGVLCSCPNPNRDKAVKATKLALDVSKNNEITIENSKTGRVTAVVTIMKVLGVKLAIHRTPSQSALL